MESKFKPILRQRREGEKGFTLIELLVVIAVLAILAAIVIFNVVGVANRGKSNACATDIKSLQTAVDAYLNDNPNTSNSSNPFGFANNTHSVTVTPTWGGWNGALVPNYLHSIPNLGGSNNECSTSVTVTQNNGSDFATGLNVNGS